MGSASWIQEGTPVPPPWHPHSTVFNQLTLYLLANLVLFTGNTSTSPLLWRASLYPQFTFQFPTGHTQSYTSSNTQALSQKPIHKSSNTHKRARAALCQVFIGSGAACRLARSANQLQALYLLYFGISASHNVRTKYIKGFSAYRSHGIILECLADCIFKKFTEMFTSAVVPLEMLDLTFEY